MEIIKDGIIAVFKKIFEYLVVAMAVYGGYSYYEKNESEVTSTIEETKAGIRDQIRDEVQRAINVSKN